MSLVLRMKHVFSLIVLILATCFSAFAQTESATLSGVIQDPKGAIVPEVEVTITRIETGSAMKTKTNGAGIYVFTSLSPGHYHLVVHKPGFKQIAIKELELNVQDKAEQNFSLEIGSVSESITVSATDLRINTTDASVGTVVDRQFVENMPLNGRSFQSLLTLIPGVVQVQSNGAGGSGEIVVNGQRTEANYFTVDGVSANTGTFSFNRIYGAGFAGGTAGETALGTTQSLVSVDALQEFRASTSTYSAEYGRTPGGQFSFSTRSGTNDWHGSAFDYFRNDALDANNWFNNAVTPQVPRQAEHQNDFGGTLGGPILIPGLYNGKNKTFFFFSYEGLRLAVPRPVQQYSVPDADLRQAAPAPLQPFLNAFPLPNAGEDGLNDGLGLFNLAYSSPSSLDAVSVRIDHNIGDKLRLFGRYTRTPSDSWTYDSPAIRRNATSLIQTLTLGATSTITHTQANELRFNITQNNVNQSWDSTSFGGATAFDTSSLPGPNGQPLSQLGSQVQFALGFGTYPGWLVSKNRNSQRQYNLTDTYSWSIGTHQLKFGVDWRRLTTYITPITNNQYLEFDSEASILANSADFAQAQSFTSVPVEPVYHNFSLFVQDEWKVRPRLALSLGLRWDVNPAPGNLIGASPYTLDQISDLTTSKLAPANTPLWKTDWHGFAPRIGIAYQLSQNPAHETVLRIGFGIFDDMGNTQGSQGFTGVGFTSSTIFSGVPLPLTSEQVTLPPTSVAPPYNSTVYAFDPNLKLPYTMQWNAALEQGLGANQSLTATYVGSAGRRLLGQFQYSPSALGNSNFPSSPYVQQLFVTSNSASSDYHALQVRYQKGLSHGLQALASYTLSHSIDDASNNFFLIVPLLRSSSDFDVRHNVQAAITYDVPGHYSNRLTSAFFEHWGLDTRISASSALPVDILGFGSPDPATQRFEYFHPDLVPGQPIYLHGSQYPGGRIINYYAFTPAPDGVEGDVPRNYARGLNAVQVDLALRRTFPIHERLNLQFRAEAFNLFNHPNFGNITNCIACGPDLFGRPLLTLNQNLGGLSPIHQFGGPRSLQMALKLTF